MSSNKILREYVREILLESEYSDFAASAGGFGPGGGYGGAMVGEAGLYRIFVKPFVTAFKVTFGKVKELSRSAQTLLNVIFETVVTTFNPAYEDSYKEIFNSHKKDLEKIKQEYAKDYGEMWDAYMQDDILIAAFMYRPDLILTGAFAKFAPGIASGILSVLTGGRTDGLFQKLVSFSKTKVAGKKPQEGELLPGSAGMGMAYYESVLREDGGATDEAAQAAALQRLLSNKKVKDLIRSNDRLFKMSNDSKKVVQETLKDLKGKAENAVKLTSLDAFRSSIGIPEGDLAKLKSLPPDEKSKIEGEILAAAKRSLVNTYAKFLLEHAKYGISKGIPKNHPYIVEFLTAAKEIKSLVP